MKKRNYKTLYNVSEISTVAIVFIIVGMIFNYLVIVGNGGLMPVYNYKYVMHSDEHFAFDDWDSVNYPVLSDHIVINNSWYSPGDLIMVGGVLILSFLQAYKIYYLFTTEEDQ